MKNTLGPLQLSLTGPGRAPGIILACYLASACFTFTGVQAQNAYLQHNLVSDLAGVADRVDTNLVNPWGIATSGTSPFWVSDNHSGLSTLYNSTGGVLTLVVKIPASTNSTEAGAPTGIIFNGSSKNFLVGTNASRFIFAGEDGTISAWSSGSNAVLVADQSGTNAIYKGLAIGSSGTNTFLYATDFHNGKVDVYDSAFHLVTSPSSFADSSIPAGFAPFGIQTFGTNVLVTYSKQDADKQDDVAGPGNGYVNLFDTAGTMVKRLISGGVLNSPWGLAMAPSGFGQFSGALLVGNFGDGTINAFDPQSGAPLGTLRGTNNAPLAIPGLWGIKFGNGGQGGDLLTLYFAAGIPGSGAIEDHGLFGSIAVASSIPLSIANASDTSLNLSWTGGTPPFLIQRKLGFKDTNWFNVMTTTNQSALVAKDAVAAFYRVFDHATNQITPFTVWMASTNEVPVVAGNALGSGILSLEGTKLSYQIAFSGLSGPAQAAHIHGIATTSQPAGVITPLNAPSASSGVMSGTVDISSYTADQLAALKNGQTYVNMHTTTNPGGELRGQVAPVNYMATLNGASEVPPVAGTSGTATAALQLVGRQLSWNVSYSGLSSPATASHVHGPASTTRPAGVLFGIGNPTGTSGSLVGTQTLTGDEFNNLVDGLTYINIHTQNNPGGEIRGQIVPQ